MTNRDSRTPQACELDERSALFLTQVAEDEAVARYAGTRGAPTDEDFGGWWLGHYWHVNRWGPTRVLSECATRRQIVGLHQPGRVGNDGEFCTSCLAEEWPCPTLRALIPERIAHDHDCSLHSCWREVCVCGEQHG